MNIEGRFTKKSVLTPSQVLDAATRYFGPNGLGLQVTGRTTGATDFVGGGGQVRVITGRAPGERTTVEVRTLEWGYHARRFLDQL
jgi:hypothetical protein